VEYVAGLDGRLVYPGMYRRAYTPGGYTGIYHPAYTQQGHLSTMGE